METPENRIATVYASQRGHGATIVDDSMRLVLNYVGFIDAKPDELFHHPLHVDLGITEIMLIREGSGRFIVDGIEYNAKQGDLLVCNDGIWHEEFSNSITVFRTAFVNFSGLHLVGLPPGFLTPPSQTPIVSCGDAFYAIERRFVEIQKVQDGAQSEAYFIANQLLGALVGDVLSVLAGPIAPRAAKSSGPALAAVVRRHIHENYSRRITLADLGKAACASPYHTCRVFAESTGSSPIAYLISYRMEVAKRYLRTSEKTIAVVADLVGYKSETQFQTVFRKIVGQTPGRYRVESREKATNAESDFTH